MLRKPLLVRLCVVAWVLFCGVFLGVGETIVGSPVLLCGYCFVECFLVLQKPLLVRLCCCVGIVLWSVNFLVLQKLLLVGLCGCCSVSF